MLELLTSPAASLQGELISYNDYQKTFKVMYDDGEDEWTSLHKEVFRWAPIVCHALVSLHS